MTDFLGNEIIVGDTVVFATHDCGNLPELRKGTIIKLTPTGATIEFEGSIGLSKYKPNPKTTKHKKYAQIVKYSNN